MSGARIHDRVAWGMNRAAAQIGTLAEIYRPRVLSDPLDPENRILRMPVALSIAKGRAFTRFEEFGTAAWQCICDTSYLQPGDFVVCDGATWFVSALNPMLPALCIRTNLLVTLYLTNIVSGVGATDYRSLAVFGSSTGSGAWPASALGVGGGGRPGADLPTDSTVPYWTVLLPPSFNSAISVTDRITDSCGRNGIVASAELTHLGWRLNIKQVTT
jgi:hypothetical protein